MNEELKRLIETIRNDKTLLEKIDEFENVQQMVELADELGINLSVEEFNETFNKEVVKLSDEDLEQVVGGRNRGDRRDSGDTGWSEVWRIMKYCIVHPFSAVEKSIKGERLPEISGSEVVDEIMKGML